MKRRPTLKSLIEEHARLISSDFFYTLLKDFQPARLKNLKKNPPCSFIPSCLVSKILPYISFKFTNFDHNTVKN